MKHKLIGIQRANRFSPNRTDNDTAIFKRVSELLQQKGCEITTCEESSFQSESVGNELIFTMARDARTLRKLQLLEDEGRTVINSAHGIENCTREKMTRLLLQNNIPYPKSRIIPTSEPTIDLSDIGHYCWIKRGNDHTIHPEDVVFARTGEESASIIRKYAQRNIPTVVINEHLEGDLIKFYGVTGTDFFYWAYSHRLNYSKFGLESINGQSQGIPFDPAALKTFCTRAAQALKVSIYGGDAVVSPDGTTHIIDLNDWPSFAPCLEPAASSIAQYIHNQL
jgi:hypothetical protein